MEKKNKERKNAIRKGNKYEIKERRKTNKQKIGKKK